MATDPDRDGLAARVVAAMYARDAASQAFGMSIREVCAARVCVSMTVRADMTQAVGTCHGGVIFSLADSAFAFACNRFNERTVAAGCGIEFLHPARVGDVLTAEAVEQAAMGRSGIYDVRVSNQNEETIALFRGKSRRISGSTIE
ncbi:hydroxyphenylacetyl-CoA thioesterase PaaI [Salinisphaera sp. P385]|uniref:Hydroxyphenylacetyl-CoA thioesterase PaaI n=1 Tax=Spectribacter acetivorans TaxID=3075603 RepID=A0ABU3B601_9GAMM|nr:hydroxyphenylacetyl-CoA thioesterase PaaI [Salinisphaera sp. P385]MDT0617876.1 hydroxyphenylacetyl-CoA thioesterase PaaI [Salinisphaera sp. P385]